MRRGNVKAIVCRTKPSRALGAAVRGQAAAAAVHLEAFLLANSESPPGTSAAASSTGPESCSLSQDDVEGPPEARARGPPRRKSPDGD